MAKVMMSARLEAGILGWAKVYAKQRDVSLAAVIEAALREFRVACEGGVPELGPSAVASARPREISPRERLMADRQARLNRGRS